MHALRSGRAVVFDREGRAYGDRGMIEALGREPVVMGARDHGYRGSG